MAERWRPAREWDPAPDDVIDIWRFDLEVRENDWAILSPTKPRPPNGSSLKKSGTERPPPGLTCAVFSLVTWALTRKM